MDPIESQLKQLEREIDLIGDKHTRATYLYLRKVYGVQILRGVMRKLEVRRSSGIVCQPPGFRLRKGAEFLFSLKTYQQVLEPILRDLMDEYCEALKEGSTWKSRWVRIRGYFSFGSAVFAQFPISTVKMVYKIWKASR